MQDIIKANHDAQEDMSEMWHEHVEADQDSAIRDGEDVLRSIQKARRNYQAEISSNGAKHSPAFYKILDRLLEQFEAKVSTTNLPEPLPDPYLDLEWGECWAFSYEVHISGIKLFLELTRYTYSENYDGTNLFASLDERFTLIDVPSKSLTVSEYAEMYKIESEILLKVLESGEIPGANKPGNEWHIPELFDFWTWDNCGRPSYYDLIYYDGVERKYGN